MDGKGKLLLAIVFVARLPPLPAWVHQVSRSLCDCDSYFLTEVAQSQRHFGAPNVSSPFFLAGSQSTTLFGDHPFSTKHPQDNFGLQNVSWHPPKCKLTPSKKGLATSDLQFCIELFRGAVFHHSGVPENYPLALMGRFPSLMGRFLTLMGRFPECLNGPFS